MKDTNAPDIHDEIERLSKIIEKTESELRTTKGRLFDLKCEAAGIHIGDVAQSTKDPKLVVRVTKIDFVLDKPFVGGVLRKKDGTFGKTKRNLLDDWKVVTP